MPYYNISLLLYPTRVDAVPTILYIFAHFHRYIHSLAQRYKNRKCLSSQLQKFSEEASGMLNTKGPVHKVHTKQKKNIASGSIHTIKEAMMHPHREMARHHACPVVRNIVGYASTPAIHNRFPKMLENMSTAISVHTCKLCGMWFPAV